MSRFNRFLLIVLLAVALPLQGGMAAAMMCCAPEQPHRAVAAHDAASDVQAPSGHCAESGALDESAPQSCASCAACCIAGALTPAALPPVADTGFHERPFAVRSLPPSFIAEGTEHPPRSVSA